MYVCEPKLSGRALVAGRAAASFWALGWHAHGRGGKDTDETHPRFMHQESWNPILSGSVWATQASYQHWCCKGPIRHFQYQ